MPNSAQLNRNCRLHAAEDCMPKGAVTLVGAGPGDPDLLTLKALRALQQADVVLYDALISDDIIGLIPSHVTLIAVGKRGGQKSCAQHYINDLMISLCCRRMNVVRLKSGDPMIFGRGGEEIDALKRIGIPVAIIPGITAAAAAASTLGVSLTHRNMAQSVRFLTGHRKHGDLPDDLDWHAIADPACTLMVYMGGRTAPKLARRLIDEGLRPATPVVLSFSLTRPDERFSIQTLSDLACGGPISTSAPVLIGIGEVFADCMVTADAQAGKASAWNVNLDNMTGSGTDQRRRNVGSTAARPAKMQWERSPEGTNGGRHSPEPPPIERQGQNEPTKQTTRL